MKIHYKWCLWSPPRKRGLWTSSWKLHVKKSNNFPNSRFPLSFSACHSLSHVSPQFHFKGRGGKVVCELTWGNTQGFWLIDSVKRRVSSRCMTLPFLWFLAPLAAVSSENPIEQEQLVIRARQAGWIWLQMTLGYCGKPLSSAMWLRTIGFAQPKWEKGNGRAFWSRGRKDLLPAG